MIPIDEYDALLIIDVQVDFCPGGRLAIAEGDAVVPIINGLMARFEHVIVTQDWHPAGHHSFASTHMGKRAYESIAAPYGEQTLWPDHCVQGTAGAEFHPELNIATAELILRKGYHREIDSYSAFLENDRQTPTGLAGYLRERGLRRLFVAGLAYDFCVRYSALDGKRLGFETIVIEDACRSVNLSGDLRGSQSGSVAATREEFAKEGIRAVGSAEIGSAEIRSAEIGSAEIGSAEIQSAEIHS